MQDNVILSIQHNHVVFERLGVLKTAMIAMLPSSSVLEYETGQVIETIVLVFC